MLKNIIKILILVSLIFSQVTVCYSQQIVGPVLGSVSSLFGLRNHPVYGYTKFHHGLDIAAPYGAPIYAMADGVVTKSGTRGGYGLAVTIDHNYSDVPGIPRVQTTYGHCSLLYAQVGQRVRRGQVIALVGSTGLSTGPHVHFEVTYRGKSVDPIDYLVKLPSYLNYIANYRQKYRYVSNTYSYR